MKTKVSVQIEREITTEDGTTAPATACSSPSVGDRMRTLGEDLQHSEEPFGFFVTLTNPRTESDGEEECEEGLLEYADQYGDPEKADVHVGVFSAGAASFGYHHARLLQTRLAGIIMTEPRKPSWKALLENDV